MPKASKLAERQRSPVIPFRQLRALRYELTGVWDGPIPLAGNRRNFIDTSYSCWFIRRGAVTISWSGGRLTARRGQWVLCDPLQRRSQSFSSDATRLSIRFQIHWEGRGPVQISGLPICVDAQEVSALLPAAEQLTELVGRFASGDLRLIEFSIAEYAGVEAAFMSFVSVWHQALAGLGASHGTLKVNDPRLGRALDLLADRDGLGVVPYAELSKASGVSRAQVDRLFLKHLGSTPRRFCEQRCLRQSETLLAEHQLSIKQIAARLHFADSSHFAKWFRRQAGLSPAAYRRHSERL